MGKDFVDEFPTAKEWFNRADAALDFPLSSAMFDGPMEELTRTSRCQPALYLHGLVALQLLKDAVPDMEVVAAAGLSLGEFTAHAAAGTFDFCPDKFIQPLKDRMIFQIQFQEMMAHTVRICLL